MTITRQQKSLRINPYHTFEHQMSSKFQSLIKMYVAFLSSTNKNLNKSITIYKF